MTPASQVKPIAPRLAMSVCAGACRLFGMVLLALAWAFLPRYAAHGHVVSPLLREFRYGRTQRPLLQVAERLDRQIVAAQCSAAFSLFRKGEPVDHPRKTSSPHANAGRRILQDRRCPRRKNGMLPLSISAEL